MVSVYFLAEIFLPGMGLVAALSELPFNLVQAAVGAIGGVAIYKGVTVALPEIEKPNPQQENGNAKRTMKLYLLVLSILAWHKRAETY